MHRGARSILLGAVLWCGGSDGEFGIADTESNVQRVGLDSMDGFSNKKGSFLERSHGTPIYFTLITTTTRPSTMLVDAAVDYAISSASSSASSKGSHNGDQSKSSASSGISTGSSGSTASTLGTRSIQPAVFLADAGSSSAGVATIAATVATTTQDPKTVLASLNSFMLDPRFLMCDQNPSDDSCVAARNEAEQTIKQEQLIIDSGLANTHDLLNSLNQEMTNRIGQIKLFNQTLTGGIFSPSLSDNIQSVVQGVSQLNSVLSGATNNVRDEISLRSQLYEQQMTNIAAGEEKSAKDAQTAMINLANSNMLSQSAQIGGIANSFQRSMADLGSQADTALATNNDQLTSFAAQVNKSNADISKILSVLSQSAVVAMKDAKAVAASGNATFSKTTASLAKAVQSQLPIYEKYADGLLSQAQVDMNSSISSAIQTVAASLDNFQLELVQQFGDDSQTVFDNITKLQQTTAQLVPSSIARQAQLVAAENDKISKAQSTAQANAQSVQNLATDTSNLLNDLMDKIKTLSDSKRDEQLTAQAQLDQQIAGIGSTASSQAGSISDGSSAELSSLSNQLGVISKSNSANADNDQDQYLSQLSSMQSSSGLDSMSGVNSISDANSAADSLAGVNTARLQYSTDSSTQKLNTASSTVMGALGDSQDTVGEMDSAFSAQNRALQLNSNQLLTDTNSANANVVSQTTSLMSQNFQDVHSSTLSSQQNSQSQMASINEAIAALSSGAGSALQQTNSVQSLLQGTSNDQLAQFQSLLGHLSSSSALVEATGAQAQAQLQTAVKNTLNGRLGDLQAKLQGNALDVTNTLSTAATDASNTANSVSNSSAALYGNFHQTSTDLNSLMASLQQTSGLANNNAQSLQNLLNSLTNQEIVNFQVQVANMSGDAKQTISNLRDYLQAMITNKTDGARSDAQTGYLSNQQSVGSVLGQTSSELSKTQDLASQAILMNQVVRANVSHLFDTFLGLESDVNNATAQHADIMRNLTQNITNWKSDIISQIQQIQVNVSNTSAALPQYAQDRLSNITALISTSQGDLQGFLNQFQDALDKAKAIQDQFQDNQSARIVSAMTGVSQAIVTASMQMASQAANSDLSASDKAKALTTILSELCDSVNKSNADAAANDASVAAKVRELSGSVNGSLADVSGKINGLMTNLATAKLHSDIDISNSMVAAVTNAGVGINASANSLDLAQSAIRNAVQKSSAGWANNNKKAYTLGGFLYSLSQQSQQKLMYILQQLQSGQLDQDQALSLARQADISAIQSAQDVVSVLAGSMDGFNSVVEQIFGDSFDRLKVVNGNMSDQVDSVVGDLVTLAEVLQRNSSMMANRVDQFKNISNVFVNDAQANVTNLQTYVFDQQAQEDKTMTGLSDLMHYAENDISLRQEQFDNWIDSIITNEQQIIANKTAALKQQLLGNSSKSSFLENEPYSSREAVAKENLKFLQMEMKELDRRRNLRKPQPRLSTD